MKIHESMYLMIMLLAHVMRGAGTFTIEEKMKMFDFIGYLINNTEFPVLDAGNSSCNQSCKTNHSNTPRIN